MARPRAYFFVLLSILAGAVHAADTLQVPQDPAAFFYSDGVQAYFAGDDDCQRQKGNA